MLVSKAPTKTVEIPGAAPNTITFRKLSSKQIRKCRKEQFSEQVLMLKEIGPELLKAMREGDTEEQKNLRKGMKQQQQEREWELDSFEIGALLKRGIKEWTLEQPPYLDTEDHDRDPTDQLDEERAVWAAEQIIEMNRPRTEEQEKKS